MGLRVEEAVQFHYQFATSVLYLAMDESNILPAKTNARSSSPAATIPVTLIPSYRKSS